MTIPARRMLTAQEAANYCGFKSVNGFQSHIRVSPVKFGTSVRYDLRDLDDYLDRLSENKSEVGFAELAGNESAHSGH
jgi:hypothetical protein